MMGSNLPPHEMTANGDDNQLAEIKASLRELHRKVDALSTRSECQVRHYDGGAYSHSYSICSAHPAGTPGCTLTANLMPQQSK